VIQQMVGRGTYPTTSNKLSQAILNSFWNCWKKLAAGVK